jgi:hypothetical protein
MSSRFAVRLGYFVSGSAARRPTDWNPTAFTVSMSSASKPAALARLNGIPIVGSASREAIEQPISMGRQSAEGAVSS